MSEKVDLNVNVDYRPQNRVMHTKRVQTIRHPPANGSVFDKATPFIHFRIQNTANTFIDPEKTRLNFNYTAKDVTGTGILPARKSGKGVANPAVAGNYNIKLSNAGVSGFFSAIQVVVGGTTIEYIHDYSTICKLFTSVQVNRNTKSGLMSITEGLMNDGAGIGKVNGESYGSNPNITTRGEVDVGLNIERQGVYINSTAASPPTAFNTMNASHSVLSAILGAGCSKYFPLAMLRAPLEVYFHLQPTIQKVFWGIGDIQGPAATPSNFDQANLSYTDANYSLSDINLELGMVVFGEDSMDLIRSQIDETMTLNWSGTQVDSVVTTDTYVKGQTEIILPACNYRNLKAMFLVQKNPSLKGNTDPGNMYGLGIKALQYSIDGKLYPKQPMGSLEDSTNGALVGEAASSFSRYLVSAINNTSANVSSGAICKQPLSEAPALPLNFGYANCSGLAQSNNTQFNELYMGSDTQNGIDTGFLWQSISAGNGLVPDQNTLLAASMDFSTGLNFCDFQSISDYRNSQGVDTSRSIVTMLINRWSGRSADFTSTIEYAHIPLFGVEYVLDLESGIMSRNV